MGGDTVFGRVSVAIVTPFVESSVDAKQPIDIEAFKSLVDFLSQDLKSASLTKAVGLVGGIIVPGTTGEQHTLTVEERSRLYEVAVTAANKHDVPIIAGIAGTNISTVVQLTKNALEAGCQGIMIVLLPDCRLRDDKIRSYIHCVKSLVPINFPIVLCNNTMQIGFGPSLALLAELCNNSTLWGIEHAVLPEKFIPQAQKLLELAPTARLYTSSDKLAGELLVQDAPLPRFYGLISILGNLFASEVAGAVLDLLSTDPVEKAAGAEAHRRLAAVADAMLVGASLPVPVPVGLKYGMRSLGLPGGYTREPVGCLPEAKTIEIDAAIQSFKI